MALVRQDSPPLPLHFIAADTPTAPHDQGRVPSLNAVRAGGWKTVVVRPFYADNGLIMYKFYPELGGVGIGEAGQIASGIRQGEATGPPRGNKRSPPDGEEYVLSELRKYVRRMNAGPDVSFGEDQGVGGDDAAAQAAANAGGGDGGEDGEGDEDEEESEDEAALQMPNSGMPLRARIEAWVALRIQPPNRSARVAGLTMTVGSTEAMLQCKGMLMDWRSAGTVTSASETLHMTAGDIEAACERIGGFTRPSSRHARRFVALYELTRASEANQFLRGLLTRHRLAEMHGAYEKEHRRVKGEQHHEGRKATSKAKQTMFELVHGFSWEAASREQKNKYNHRMRHAKQHYMLRAAIGAGAFALSEITIPSNAWDLEVQVLGEAINMFCANAVAMARSFVPVFDRAVNGQRIPPAMMVLEANEVPSDDVERWGTAWFDCVPGQTSNMMNGPEQTIPDTQPALDTQSSQLPSAPVPVAPADFQFDWDDWLTGEQLQNVPDDHSSGTDSYGGGFSERDIDFYFGMTSPLAMR